MYDDIAHMGEKAKTTHRQPLAKAEKRSKCAINEKNMAKILQAMKKALSLHRI